MKLLVDVCFRIVNMGILAGLMTLAMLLLRPVLLRLFTAQQRAVVWLVVWSVGYLPGQWRGVLPVTFQDLFTSRTGEYFSAKPAYLPVSYEGPGDYHLALPGDVMVRVGLNDALVYGAALLWLAGAAALVVYFILQSRKLTALAKQGRELDDDDPMLRPYRLNRNILERGTDVWISPGLPTSFVRHRMFDSNQIVIQAELPPEQMELVLLHEAQHVHLFHPWWKVIGTINLVLFWWNPLIWVGFRYFCRDLELACDASVLKKLAPERRKEYARTLVELGEGRQLWEVPLAFGECDTARRVKAAVGWKPRNILLGVVTWCAAAGMILFFFGGSRTPYPTQDLVLAYEREYGSMESFVEELNYELAKELDLIERYGVAATPAPDLGITQVWEAPDWTYQTKLHAGFSAEKGVQYKTITSTHAALWVQTGDGQWYYTAYGWWGEGTNTFGLLRVEECAPPDLTGAYRVV